MPRSRYSSGSWYALRHEKKRPEKAVKIQTWWRRMLEVRTAKEPLRTIFEGDITGLTGLRCLVLIGVRDDVLGTWTKAMIQLGPEVILDRALGEQSASWLVLLRKAALLLVLSLADAPESLNASSYLTILMVLLSNERAVAASSAQGGAFCQAITAYLMKRNIYDLLSKSITKLPIEHSTNLQHFLRLCTLPLFTYPKKSPQYTKIYVNIFFRILSLPLLPKRLPPGSPSPFISYFLLTDLDKFTELISSIGQLAVASSPDLAANLFMFISPHYETLSPAVFASYLQLTTKLMNTFNSCAWSLSPPSESGSEEEHASSIGYDSDSSDGHSNYQDSQLENEDTMPYPLEVTAKSIEWISEVATPQHLAKLIKFTQSQAILLPHLAAYLFTVTATWPSSQQEIWNTVLASSGGGLVGALYRGLVKWSPLGQQENAQNLYKSASAIHWPPVILLADLYSQALQTMDDEEFLGKAPGSRGRNPLTLAEVSLFSVQLLNIVFSFYLRYPANLYVSSDVYCSWKALREKLLRCLSRIHARDCRRPFVLLGHWLLRSQLDMDSFVDTVIIQEQRSSRTYYSEALRRITNHQWKCMLLRLSILKKIPFAIPCEVRVSIFQHLIANDRVLHGSTERLNASGHDQRLKVKIRRSMVVRDGFNRLAELDLKAPLEIVMIDQFGQEEEGIDSRGHFKEFFKLFCQEVFQTNSVLWLKTKWGDLYPTSDGHETEDDNLDMYWFIGSIIGKAIYEGILMEARFADFFLSKWLGRRSYFNELFSLDPNLHRRLLTLKHSTDNIEDLSLRFNIIVTQESGVAKTVDLIPNGREIAVTRENKLRYIDLFARYRLNAQVKRQSQAFVEGLSRLIKPEWLKMFNQQELQILVGGTYAPIDLDNLRRHTTYGGIYHDGHSTIVAFWRVANSFHQWQKRSLLRFVTSCSRPHVLGFQDLVPNFSIRDDGSHESRLPRSSTCVNLLKLPIYKSDRQLREMLLQAINSRAGFDSS